MNLQAALVILSALGVNGLPTLAPKALQEREARQPVLNTGGCGIEEPWCTPPEETGKAKRQEDARWNQLLRSRRLPQPTQTPATAKRQRNTEGFSPSSGPNPNRGGPPATKINSEIGTVIFPARPTNGSSPLGRRFAQTTPLESPDGPTQPGQTSSCDGWYNIKEGDTCDTVTMKFNIKREQFMEWNPAVSKNCDIEPWVNYSCCVGISGSKRAKRTESFTFTIPTPTMPAIKPPFGKGIQARQMSTVTWEQSQPITIDDEGNFVGTSPAPQFITVTFGPDGKPIKPIRARATQSIEPFPVSSLPYARATQTPKVGDKSEKRNEIPEITRSQTIECSRQWTVGPNDTCESIASTAGISVAELVALNPITLANCNNMPVSQQVCLRAGKSVRPVSNRDLPVLSPTPTIK